MMLSAVLVFVVTISLKNAHRAIQKFHLTAHDPFPPEFLPSPTSVGRNRRAVVAQKNHQSPMGSSSSSAPAAKPMRPTTGILRRPDHCIHQFSDWMDTQWIATEINQAILEILKEIRQPPPSRSWFCSPAMAAAFRSQRCIGCQGLFEGRISTKWLPLQQSYLRSFHSRRLASLWASRMSQQLIQIGFSMWEHRNSIKHSDLSLQAQARIHQVDDAIHSQFDMGTADFPRNIRLLLSGDRRRVLRKFLADKELWLELCTITVNIVYNMVVI